MTCESTAAKQHRSSYSCLNLIPPLIKLSHQSSTSALAPSVFPPSPILPVQTLTHLSSSLSPYLLLRPSKVNCHPSLIPRSVKRPALLPFTPLSSLSLYIYRIPAPRSFYESTGSTAMAFADGGLGMDPCRFAVHVVRGRWFMLFSSFLIMAAAGATYIFSVYSKDIKTSLGYDQSTLNTLSFFKDLGANVGVISGLINEVTPPWVVLSMGAGMNLFGYLMIYLAITGRTAPPQVWLMCLYICIGANSQTFANTGALVTCVKNFPESRGVVLGLLKGFVGLSGAIITQLYHAIYGDDSKSVVLLIAWLPAAVSIVFVHTVRIMDIKVPQGETPKPFFCFLYISIALATYLMIAIVIENRVTFTQSEFGVSAAIVILLLLLPLAVVVKEELRVLAEKNRALQSSQPLGITVEKPAPPPSSEPKPTSSSSDKSKDEGAVASCFADMFRPPNRGEDYSIMQALVSIDMIVLFFATICGVGGTLTAIDNMGQIGESQGYPKRSISTFVSLVSIWNYAGRVAAGFASEILLDKYKFPRPLMLTFILLLSCVGHLLIAFGPSNSLYFASVIIGFCFGAQWPLLFAIISEIFGLKYYSTLYNFGGVASPIGSYILNVRVTGHLYDREALKHNNGVRGVNGKDLTCIGTECFKLSFLIITAVTVLGAAVSMILVWRTKDFYKGDIYARFREQRAAAEHEMAVGGFSLEGRAAPEEEGEGEEEAKRPPPPTTTASEEQSHVKRVWKNGTSVG